MKKILTSLILSMIAVCGLAQEHLNFKGIPIEGSLSEFCQKLKTKGFVETKRDNGLIMFKGEFTGREATIGVIASDDGKNVHSVAVIFDQSSEWKTLLNTYTYLKDLYIRKYGQPSACVEQNPSHSDDNYSLMRELSQGTVTYMTAWNALGGTIEMTIEKFGYRSGVVTIKYHDTQNIKNKIQQDLEDI